MALGMLLTGCCPAFGARITSRASPFMREGAIISGDSPTSHRMNRRRSYHSEHFEQRSGIQLVVTEHVADYRAAVEALVTSDDVALEVGCAGGKTTDFLSRCARFAIGVDKSDSPGLLAEQRGRTRENTRFAQVDATDIGTLLQLSEQAANEAREAIRLADGNRSDETRPLQATAATPSGFSVILIDISGSAKLSSVLDLIDRYEKSFGESLRLIIVKSFRFACLVDRVQLYEAAR